MRSALLRRPLSRLGALLILLGALAAACGSDKPADRVHILTWDGVVNPVMARYIDRGIDAAEESDARAVVIQLDTPGGLDSSMRDIIKRIEASKVPVIVYVSPSGARAASAGTFITMAGHVAAMSPNTSIGAATPINSSGDDIEGALGRKVTNDAVSYIRGIAELRGRNADWAESAVRDAVSVNENEAVRLNVVDFTATGQQDLLTKSDGRTTTVADEAGGMRSVTLRTAGAATVDNGTTMFEELLNLIADPNIAFLLLTMGGLAIVIEIIHPTFGIGIAGVISLILAWLSLDVLPTNWAGVALIVLGFTLMGAEVFVSGFGALGIGGIIAFILGGMILMSGSEAGFEVSLWLILSMAAIAAVILLGFVGLIVKSRRMPAHPGQGKLVGAKGTARTRLDPGGYVYVHGERWEAEAEPGDGPIEEKTPIVVTDASGLRLVVKRDPESVKLLPAAPEAPVKAGSA